MGLWGLSFYCGQHSLSSGQTPMSKEGWALDLSFVACSHGLGKFVKSVSHFLSGTMETSHESVCKDSLRIKT